MEEMQAAAGEVVERAGIERKETFEGWLDGLGAKASELMERVPPAPEVADRESYDYARRALAEWRKLVKEGEEGRKRITRELDKAKKAVTSATAERLAPVSEAIGEADASKKAYEGRLKDEKRERLREYWEGSYPALALCAGEASEPLVPFDRVFDPDWTKRFSEAADDSGPREEMDALADRLAASEKSIQHVDGKSEAWRVSARRHLFESLDFKAAIEAADEEARRARDLERMARAAEGVEAGQGPEPEPAQVALRPPEGTAWVVACWCATDEEKQEAVEAMRAAGLHGTVRKVER